MAITYRLQAFEGPLDLLLHLIEINKIDIYDIPIAEITDQYLDYISRMEAADMEIASEFLVMAATLLRIKSRMLLPVEKTEEIDEQDPRLELVRRLLEYKMYRMIGQELDEMSEAAERTFYKGRTIPADLTWSQPKPDPEELLEGTDMMTMKRLFEAALKRQAEKIDPIRSRYGQIEREPVSVSGRISDIRRTLRRSSGQKVSFRGLMQAGSSRLDVIVTFLAILEMMKSGAVTIRQEALFEDIEIMPGEKLDEEITDAMEVD